LTAPTYGASYGEGKVQGVVKATQTGILWSQVQVLVGPPTVKKATDFGQWLFLFQWLISTRVHATHFHQKDQCCWAAAGFKSTAEVFQSPRKPVALRA
jgi:hypothetical protein